MTMSIDLFRLYILFSQYRLCDDTQEIWSFVLFIKKRIFMLACTLFNEEDKGSNLLSIITWSVLGKQNVQAKKVYYCGRIKRLHLKAVNSFKTLGCRTLLPSFPRCLLLQNIIKPCSRRSLEIIHGVMIKSREAYISFRVCCLEISCFLIG